MMLWFILALMTVVAIGGVIWPLTRTISGRGGSHTAVYRDQLDEIARDQSAGIIGKAEAEAAKVEVSRRLIAAADVAAAEKSRHRESPVWRRGTAFAALVLLPVGAVALYLTLGMPQMPGEPLTGRVQSLEEDGSIGVLVARVEDHVAHNPADGRAWEVLAPVYMRLGRFDDAVTAWRNAIRLNGSSASREADYGEALVAAGNGVVTDEAKAAFDRAIALDGQDVMARFYLGMAADQDGRRSDADAIWRDLLASAPRDAPWAEVVRHAMARSAPISDADATPVGGPSAADMAAAATLPPVQQDQMIAGMVARLAERLKKNGSDVEGWLRLVHSYRVLGQEDKAQVAITDAGRALFGDADKLRQFAEGIDSAATPTSSPRSATTSDPSADDIAAAAKMDPDQQNKMIRSMVSRLASRLQENGKDIDGWQRLIRAYMVLGDREKAHAAAAEARRALGDDSNKLRQIDDTIKSLGLES
jgi:cytochrome c-type biogenesis protein CcmH